MESEKTQSTVAWLGLVISIVALIVGWLAYNRAGQDLEQQVVREVDQAINMEDVRSEINQKMAMAEARARLMLLQARLNTGLSRDAAAKEVADIRADLRDEMKETKGEVNASWMRIDNDLAQLEPKVRSGAADALQGVENVIRALKLDIATDENK